LDVDGSCLCNYKLYNKCGCGSILSTGATHCAVEFLLDLDVAKYNVYYVGECETLGELAGETDG